MLQKLRKLRTNENILIAVDVLINSKSAFMNIFLMAFMMRVSLSESPVDFIVYGMTRYACMGIFSILLMNFVRRHTLAAWRLSMIFSVLQMIVVILLGGSSPYFVYVLAVLAALESVLYWRPKIYYDTTEVGEDRRVRYHAFGQTLIEVGKIIMPTVLGVLIADHGYEGAANVILIIASMELLLSVLFRPTKKHQRKTGHSLARIWQLTMRHKSLRRYHVLQFLRGLLVSSAAYVVISQINIYRALGSDISLGIYTSLAAVFAILLLLFFQKRCHSSRSRAAFAVMTLPAVILVPIVAWYVPNDATVVIALYLVAQSIVESFWNKVAVFPHLQSIIRRHIRDDAFRIEVECVGESALTMGRLVSLGILLTLVSLGVSSECILFYMILESLVILPVAFMCRPSRRKSANIVK